MTNEIKHTPTPWFYNYQHDGIYDAPDIRGESVCIAGIKRIPDYKANVEFIVRAVNSHDALVEALKDAHEQIKLIYVATATNAKGRDDNKVYKSAAVNIINEALKLVGAE
jgi:hypothetical protein